MRALAAAIAVTAGAAGAWLGMPHPTVTVPAGDDVEATIAAASPGTRVVLGAGSHGGFTVGSPSVVIRGEEGAVVDGDVVIGAADVTLERLTIDGNEDAVSIREVTGVRLRDIDIRRARMHGILITDASVHIDGCSIGGLGKPWGQGIEIRNADSRPATVIEGCSVSGAMEGIVSHVSRVVIRDNTVRDTRLRAIAITEMSRGTATGNTVRDALGVGIYCGDMSVCDITRNSVTGVRADPNGVRSRAGYGVVAWYMSDAYSDANLIGGADGGAEYATLGSRFTTWPLVDTAASGTGTPWTVGTLVLAVAVAVQLRRTWGSNVAARSN